MQINIKGMCFNLTSTENRASDGIASSTIPTKKRTEEIIAKENEKRVR